MKFLNKLTTGIAALSLSTALFLASGGMASAACWQYDPSGFTTSNTPVFNNICGVPNGIGNESDFVRIRPNTTGDDTSTSNNSAYVDTLSSACNSGDKFDIHTYIHNDATPDQNNNGSGTAVAHGVQLSLAAPTGNTGSNFTFASTVTATNAATVKDTATLNCNGQPVKLTLVPGTVKIYGTQYPWTGLPDNSVNGTFKIGSPVMGSGDIWGCWEYRVVVVYEVQVQKEVPPATAQCTLLSIFASDNRKVTVSNFTVTQTNAALKSVVLDWGDTNKVTLNSADAVKGQTHTYDKDGTFLISAVATFSVEGQPDIVSGGPGTACAQQVVFSPTQPPKVTPPPTTPSTLVNTGPGTVAGLFAATTIAGTAAYRKLLARKLSRQ
jgi:hypothetical protein